MDNSSGSLFTGPILSPLTSYVVLCCDLMELSFSVVLLRVGSVIIRFSEWLSEFLRSESRLF